MAEEIKLTKNELRAQQTRLGQLNKYLPTLQLKKAMLQSEVNNARAEIGALEEKAAATRRSVEQYQQLFSQDAGVALEEQARVQEVRKGSENIAGVEVPIFEEVIFHPSNYSLFATSPWVDGAVNGLRAMVTALERVKVAREKKAALEHELREVSIRVNLFEKVLSPRALKNIKRIKVFLGDQELAAVSQAKVAKTKIEKRKAAAQELIYAN